MVVTTGSGTEVGPSVCVGVGVSAGAWAAAGCAPVSGSGVAAEAAVATAGAACSPPQAARAVRHSSSTADAIPVPVGLPLIDFMAPFSAPGKVWSIPRLAPCSTPVVASAVPAPLSFCFSGADLLQESGQFRVNQGLPFRVLGTVGGRGQFSPPGYVRRSEDRFCEPQSRRLAEAGLARHPVGCGRCGAAQRTRGLVSCALRGEFI